MAMGALAWAMVRMRACIAVLSAMVSVSMLPCSITRVRVLSV
jgi:ethanolamine transporter EutH